MRLAIFDFDDTLLRGNSWQIFFRHELRRRPVRMPLLLSGLVLRRTGIWTGARLRRSVLAGLRGLLEAEVRTIGETFYRAHLVRRLRRDGLATITERRAAGFTIVLATGTWDFIAAPLARACGIDAIIATKVRFAAGRCVGVIDGPEECLGAHKAASIQRLFTERDQVDWQGSCAYTDSRLDIPMLQLVGERWLVSDVPVVPPDFPPNTQLCRWLEV